MVIKFKTDNAAFKDPYGENKWDDLCKEAEVIRILENIIDKIRCNDTRGPIMDINGNKIGEWSL